MMIIHEILIGFTHKKDILHPEKSIYSSLVVLKHAGNLKKTKPDVDQQLEKLKTEIWYRHISTGAFCVNLSPGTVWGLIGLMLKTRQISGFEVVNKGGWRVTLNVGILTGNLPLTDPCVHPLVRRCPLGELVSCAVSPSDGTSSRRLRAARGVYLWPAGSAPLSQLPKQSHSTLCWVHQCSTDTHTHTHTLRGTHTQMHTAKNGQM